MTTKGLVKGLLYLKLATSKYLEPPDHSEEVILLMSLDLAVSLGVGDAGQDETVAHLIIVEEALVLLINGATNDLTGAGAARASSAGIRKIDAGFLSSVEDVNIFSALEGLLTIGGDKSNGGHHLDISAGASTGTSGGETLSHVVALDGSRAVVADRESGSVGTADEHLGGSTSH